MLHLQDSALQARCPLSSALVPAQATAIPHQSESAPERGEPRGASMLGTIQTATSRKREREEEPSELWQSFGLAQPGDRVGLATTTKHHGLTAIVKYAHPDHHWPSLLRVTLEDSEQEIDVKRSDVKLLTASTTLVPEPLSDPGCETLEAGLHEDLRGEAVPGPPRGSDDFTVGHKAFKTCLTVWTLKTFVLTLSMGDCAEIWRLDCATRDA